MTLFCFWYTCVTAVCEFWVVCIVFWNVLCSIFCIVLTVLYLLHIFSLWVCRFQFLLTYDCLGYSVFCVFWELEHKCSENRNTAFTIRSLYHNLIIIELYELSISLVSTEVPIELELSEIIVLILNKTRNEYS